VYLPLYICCCVSAAVYPPLCICHCVYCVVYPLLYLLLVTYHCVSAAVYLPPCICCCVYRAVYLEQLLYICHCEYVSWLGTVYLAVYLSLYIYLPWCICHWICCVVYPPLYLLLCIRCCLSDAAIRCCLSDTCIRWCVSATVYLLLFIRLCYPLLFIWHSYPPLCFCHCVSAAVDLLLCICHCVSATVSTVLYIHHCICYCISTTVSAVLYIHCCICRCISTILYLLLCICHCVCCVVYLPLFLPLYIYHCGETAELEGREPFDITLLHLSLHSKGIREKERFWIEEWRNRVRGYDKLPSHEEPHKLRGSRKTRQECMGPRAGKDRVSILLYSKMMSIYPGVYQIYILPVTQSTSIIPVSPYASPCQLPLPMWAVVVRNRVSCHTAVYPPLCVWPCECVSWSGTVYLLLYILHCISTAVSVVLLRVMEYKKRLN